MLRDSGIPLWEPYAPSKTLCCPLVFVSKSILKPEVNFQVAGPGGGRLQTTAPNLQEENPKLSGVKQQLELNPNPGVSPCKWRIVLSLITLGPNMGDTIQHWRNTYPNPVHIL